MAISNINFDNKIFEQTIPNFKTIIPFNYNNTIYLFFHSEDKKWEIRAYNNKPKNPNDAKVVSSGIWARQYAAIKLFSCKDSETGKEDLFMFGHSETDKRWFISAFKEETKNFEKELCSGQWDKFYENLEIYTYQNDIYLYAIDKTNTIFLAKAKIKPY